MRRSLLVVVLSFAVVAPILPAASAPSFQRVLGFATKTGFRGVVSWQASEPIAGSVEWGTNASSLTRIALPIVDLVDNAGLAFLENVPTGATVYYRVRDRISGIASSVRSFEARNAYTDWNPSEQIYTMNMVIAMDTPSIDEARDRDLSLPEVADAVNVMAERLYDALDGWARLGTVLVTDTTLNHPGHVPFIGTACTDAAGHPLGGTPADALIETAPPYDSHTFSGWMVDDGCTGFYVGRRGQLYASNWTGDLHLGYVMTHELMHYAFNSPDLYGSAANDCNNPAWDGSLMHNSGGYRGGRWRLTELDRSQSLTPCTHGPGRWSWPELRTRWTNVPAGGAPQNQVDTLPRGNPDGGALQIYILRQRAGGLSSLTPYAPVDSTNPW